MRIWAGSGRGPRNVTFQKISGFWKFYASATPLSTFDEMSKFLRGVALFDAHLGRVWTGSSKCYFSKNFGILEILCECHSPQYFNGRLTSTESTGKSSIGVVFFLFFRRTNYIELALIASAKQSTQSRQGVLLSSLALARFANC